MFKFVIIEYDTFRRLLVFWDDELEERIEEFSYLHWEKDRNNSLFTVRPYRAFTIKDDSEIEKHIIRIKQHYQYDENYDRCCDNDNIRIYNGKEIEACRAVIFNEKMLQFWLEKEQLPKITKLLNGKRFNYTLHKDRLREALRDKRIIKSKNNQYIIYWDKKNGNNSNRG